MRMIGARHRPRPPSPVLERVQALAASGGFSTWQDLMAAVRREGLDPSDDALAADMARIRLEFETRPGAAGD